MPAYNEAESISNVITSIKTILPNVDILVVNDGSKDTTSHIAKKLNVHVVDLPYNMGIGAAMQAGYRYAHLKNYEIAIQVDADGQHPPDQIDYLLSHILSGKINIVIGSRFLNPPLLQGRGEKEEYHPSLARNIGITVFSKIVSLIIGQRITDPTSGFRAVNKEVIKFFAKIYPEDYPEVEAIVLLSKAGFSIMEAPVMMRARTGGKSSITPFYAVYYMTKVLLALFVDMLKKIER